MIDQFETEAIHSYSGSYTDSIVDKATVRSGSTSIGMVIGSKIFGLNSNFDKISIPFTQRLEYVSGNFGGRPTQNLYSQAVSSEIFYDSVPPNFLSIHLSQAKVPNFGNSTANGSNYGFLSSSATLKRPSIPINNVPIIIAPAGSRSIFTSHVSSEFINFSWKEAPWAFSSRYRTIERLEQFQYSLTSPVQTTTKSLDGTNVPSITCNTLGSLYWALPVNDTTVPAQPLLFASTGSNISSLYLDHVHMPCGFDLRDIIYNSSTGDVVSGSVQDVYVSVGREYGIAYSYNGIRWYPTSGFITNPVLITGSGLGLTDRIAYSVDGSGGTAGRHRRYVIVNTRVNAEEGGIIVQTVSKKIPTTDQESDWASYTNGDLATGGYISGLPASTQVNIKGICFNDPYGYMADANGRFVYVGSRNNSPTLPLIVLADRNATVSAASMTYVASPVAQSLEDVTVSLTATNTSARLIAVGRNGTIIHSSDATGAGSWTNVSVATAETLNSVAARPSNSTNSTIITAGTNGVVYRATKTDVPAISAFSSAGMSFTPSLPANTHWRKVIPVKRTDTDIGWILVGYAGASVIPQDTYPPVVYYSTAASDGLAWQKIDISNFKDFVHDPAANYAFLAGIASVPSATLTPSSTNNGYKNIPTLLLGGISPWNFSSGQPLILAKISEVETFFSGTSIYSKNFETQPCIYSQVRQIRPITGRLELDGYYHKNIIPDETVPYKHFFGYGDGITFQFIFSPYGGFYEPINKFPKFLFINNAPQNSVWDIYDGWEERGPETIKIYGGTLRGWHYGLLSGIKMKSKAIFRRGRFGQLRDMLEQRVVSKVLDFDTNDKRHLSDSVVKIRFVSGSLAYVRAQIYLTASNPDFNPTDSGQFDYEYKSGQPYFDDVDLTQFR